MQEITTASSFKCTALVVCIVKEVDEFSSSSTVFVFELDVIVGVNCLIKFIRRTRRTAFHDSDLLEYDASLRSFRPKESDALCKTKGGTAPTQ